MWKTLVRLGGALTPLLLLMLWLPAVAAAQEDAAIADTVVANSDREVLLYFRLEHGFAADMEKALNNGIPLTFTYLVTLTEKRTLLPDREVADLAFERTLAYDSLKEEYRVEFGDRQGKAVAVPSLAAAETLMSEVNGLEVAPLSELVPEAEYELAVKAKLAKKTMPFTFHSLVPFWRSWDFETEWRVVRFRY